MILNPIAVLNELIKYQKIIELARSALLQVNSGQSIDEICSVLKVKLNECEFTQFSSSNTVTIPLYSITAYINNQEVLTQKINEAESFVKTIIDKIKIEVGPFYKKSDISKFAEIDEIELPDQIWTPTCTTIKVKRYIDTSTGNATQVDWDHNHYRTAKDGEIFGPWKLFLEN